MVNAPVDMMLALTLPEIEPNRLDAMIATLPSMREPTVAMLHGGAGMAVKAAVPRSDLPRLIPLLKGLGASDIVVSRLEQIVP